jgi:hypothetical protein
MEPTDITIEILKSIRDEVRGTNQRLETLQADLIERLDRVERRQTESDVRVATELVALGGTMCEMRDAFLGDRALRAQVADHERRIQSMERRSG